MNRAIASLAENRGIFKEARSIGRPDDLSRALCALELTPPSVILSHRGPCCLTAYSWFSAVARGAAALHPEGPSWINDIWQWGPTHWPLHWCEVAAADVADCGALACLAALAFRAAGESVLPAQLLELYDESTIANWRAMWQQDGHNPQWLFGCLAYHEAVAVVRRPKPGSNGRLDIRIWDPTNSRWLEWRANGGYGTSVAVKVCDESPQHSRLARLHRFVWGGRLVSPNRWAILAERRDVLQTALQPTTKE